MVPQVFLYDCPEVRRLVTHKVDAITSLGTEMLVVEAGEDYENIPAFLKGCVGREIKDHSKFSLRTLASHKKTMDPLPASPSGHPSRAVEHPTDLF